MAVIVNQIGSFQFIELQGQPDQVMEQIEIIQRLGVDGVGLRKLGARGVPFQLHSRVDANTMGAARVGMNRYKRLIGGDPVSLYWNGLDISGGESVNVAVLKVRQSRLQRIATSVGGISSSAGAWLEAIWTLILV